jgi:RNA polymerase sigma factor (sigma-70 family)
MRVAVNLERRHWRKQQLCLWRKTEVKTAGLAHLSNWLPNDQRSIEDQIGAREKVKCVWCAICGLSNERKIVFLLHCVDEMTSSEIAEITDLHERTVRALLAEALSRIREAIREGAGSSLAGFCSS